MMPLLKKYSFLLLFAMLYGLKEIKAQDDSLFRLLKRIDYPVSSFSVDNLGSLYVINSENQLKKLNADGDSVGVFNQVARYGKLSYVEAQNPWKTLLFYKNFSTIVLLDKYLNVVGSINLGNKNIFRVKAVTSSYDNKIWLFDEQDNKMKKIDDNGNLLSESVDFRLLFDSVPSPEKIIDQDGFLYLYDPQKGVFQFDYYGAFKNKLTFLNWTNIQVIGKTIYGFDQEYLYKYSPPLPDIVKYKLPATLQNNSSIRLSNHKVYVLKNGAIEIHSLN